MQRHIAIVAGMFSKFVSFRLGFGLMKAKIGTYVLAAGRRITDSATLITDLRMARSGKKEIRN